MPDNQRYSIARRNSRAKVLRDTREIFKWCMISFTAWSVTTLIAYLIGVAPALTYILSILAGACAVMMFTAGMDFNWLRFRVIMWGDIVLCDPQDDGDAQKWLRECNIVRYHHWDLGVFVFVDRKHAVAMKLRFHQ